MAVYYVDNQSPSASDTNSGSASAPFQTLNKANSTVTSGDTVMVAPGTYREQVVCRTDNTKWRAIKPGVYVRGSVRADGVWSAIGGGVFSMPYVTLNTPRSLLFDGSPFAVAASIEGLVDEQFYYDSISDKLYVNTGGVDPSMYDVEIGEYSSCFTLVALTGCVIEGFHLVGSNGYGVRVQGGGNHTIRNNEVSGHAAGGIRVEPPTPQLFWPNDHNVGGALESGTYFYAVTAVMPEGETLPSFVLDVAVDDNSSIQVQWSRVAGALSYNVYGRSGSSQTYITNVVQPTSGFPSWIDDGSMEPDSMTGTPRTSSVSVTPCLIEGNECWRNMSTGVYLYAASNCTVRGNKCHHNAFHGIGLVNGSNNNTIELNVCYRNSRGNRTANGIQVDRFGSGTSGSSNNIIRRNRCFRNEDSGISIYSGSNECVAVQNICYMNGDHGIDVSNAQSSVLINNLIYRNATSGLQIEGASQGANVFNNISVDNGVNSPRTTGNYRVDSESSEDIEIDNNLSYLSTPAMQQTGSGDNAEITWGTIKYATFSEFRTAVNDRMRNSVSADPQFADSDNSSFRLLPLSPARKLGTADAPNYTATDFLGLPFGAIPNAGPFA